MKTLSKPLQPVPSPCVSQCAIDTASGLCKGCLRNIDEIIAWGNLHDDGKRQVWGLIEQRKAQSLFS